ncbi:MAG TPA: prepilin peptidase [Caulobacteraceae bacterium]|nr:prepilin peptidase [Caulobacteraceae bacterium]
MTPQLLDTLAPAAPFAALVIVAALKDLTTFTIPNWISAALVLAFAPAALVARAPLAEIGLDVALAIAVFALAAAMFALGWVGGGDAKLMAAASLWLGLKGLAPFALFTGLAGGVLALGLLALRTAWLRPIAEAGPAWTRRLATPGESAPYGVAIALGALAAFAVHPLA